MTVDSLLHAGVFTPDGKCTRDREGFYLINDDIKGLGETLCASLVA